MLIDGVFAGGGVKGFAFIGALEELEKRNYRFKRVAGTSAGALVASLIMAGYTSEELNDMMEELNPQTLLDPTPWTQHFPLLLKWLGVYWGLGLYKGNRLEEWVGEKLAAKGIRTFNDLPSKSLRIVASDLTRGQLLVLPDDLHVYGIIPETFPIARAVRMSCSLPYFFQPVKLFDKNGETAIIVDGGILSNFPMWLFRREERVKRPLLGFQLNPEPDDTRNTINNALELYSSVFETMQKGHDARYVEKHKQENVVFIPVNRIKTTSFSLTKEDRKRLVQLGREATQNYLKSWSG
ncbi:patatin-like phospholipase family protein [Salicibibacter cibarius]|uniref:Patatin-like phospholipase family protein n=1 Tax=Salicibibacter cibarius TaxID=2743000 RepID=A0A7T6Z2R7_9BACI|nr:patatin-like phospholipase family protein [Salicibibacter cibarius]QQK75909.1 patatin-like phospholipase family protein [Salicibibacter cibarius]